MSSTTVIYPTIAALVKAEEIIGPERPWQTVNQTQALFLNRFFAPYRGESLSITEIESIASFTNYEINQFLSDRGFKIQLPPFENGDDWKEFGVVSVLDLLFYWFKPGMCQVEGLDGKFYPAVELGAEVSSFI